MSDTFHWCLDKNKLKTFGKQVFRIDVWIDNEPEFITEDKY